jgi:ElaA protein
LKWIVRSFDRLSLRELHDLLRLRVDVFVAEQRCAYPEIDGKDPESTHLLGYEDSELCAYARWYPDGRVAVVGRIVVRRNLRRRGLGRELMERIFEGVGDRTIRISAQQRLEGYYQRLGFETRSEPYDDYDIPHVEMHRAPPVDSGEKPTEERSARHPNR